jgi:hypothetical protein
MNDFKPHRLALAWAACALSLLSATAAAQQIYVQQPNDGYAEGQTIYIDSQGGKYVLHPDGRTRVTPMLKIDGCDVGLKWAPIAGIYWCPTYSANPDPVTPTPVVTNPPVSPPDGPSADEAAYQQWLYDWNNYQAALANQAQMEAAQQAQQQPTLTPPIDPDPYGDVWICNHNATAYTWDHTQGGNCSNHD